MKNIEELIKKYWKGTSEVEEEQKLKKHVHKNEKLGIEDEYFNYLNQKKNAKLIDPDFDKNILQLINEKHDVKRALYHKINWQVAAAILLLFSAGVIFINRQVSFRDSISSTNSSVEIDTYEDPQLAFEETKKALLLISSNLNKGNEYTAKLSKFSETQQNLKN